MTGEVSTSLEDWQDMTMEIETSQCTDTGQLHSYFVRGHVDVAEFYRQVEYDYTPNPMPPIGYVRHIRWRVVPRAGWSEYVEGTGRGTFPVTVLDVEQYRIDRALPGIIAANERSHEAWCTGCAEDAPCWRMATINTQRERLREALQRMGEAA